MDDDVSSDEMDDITLSKEPKMVVEKTSDEFDKTFDLDINFKNLNIIEPGTKKSTLKPNWIKTNDLTESEMKQYGIGAEFLQSSMESMIIGGNNYAPNNTEEIAFGSFVQDSEIINVGFQDQSMPYNPYAVQETSEIINVGLQDKSLPHANQDLIITDDDPTINIENFYSNDTHDYQRQKSDTINAINFFESSPTHGFNVGNDGSLSVESTGTLCIFPSNWKVDKEAIKNIKNQITFVSFTAKKFDMVSKENNFMFDSVLGEPGVVENKQENPFVKNTKPFKSFSDKINKNDPPVLKKQAGSIPEETQIRKKITTKHEIKTLTTIEFENAININLNKIINKAPPEPPVLDTLDIQSDAEFKKELRLGEKIYWSGELIKINDKNNAQIRMFVVTDQRLINYGNKDFGNKLKAFFKGTNLKRSIELNSCEYISYSLFTNEWILHILKEYDFRLSSKNGRNVFLYYFLWCREKSNNFRKENAIKFYMNCDKDLAHYVRTKDQKH